MDRSAKRITLGLAGVLMADAAFDALAEEWIRNDLVHLRLPYSMRLVFPPIKTASAVGLVAGTRWPRLGRLTAALLVVYFILAVGAHARVKDALLRYGPAAAMLAWSIVALGQYRNLDSS